MPVSKRLSAAEAARCKGLDGRRCAACGTVYERDKVPDNFAPDARTSDGYSRLCIDCLLLRDQATARRSTETKADYSARQRADLKATRLARTRELLDAALPDHGVPLVGFDDYPDPNPHPDSSRPRRTPAQTARLTWLYGMLRDFELTTWEQVSAQTRQLIRQRIGFGVASFAAIDEHLIALGLPPLKP